MSIGISKEQWADTPEPEGFKLCPKGTGLGFEITKICEDHSENKNHDYVQVVCTYTDDEGVSYDHWEYFALTTERLGWFKKFLKGIGRCDLMHAEASFADLEGTTFYGDITHKMVNGEMRSNLNANSLACISHDITEMPDGGDSGDDGKASPKRPARGRARR